MQKSPPSLPWYHGVIYQIYPRSFYDSNGDGIGDLKGILEKLPYVASLGVDAVWISPFFKSPMKDFGYDVSDYCAPDPMFGTLEDVEAVIKKAHELGLKIMFDMVWAHTSDAHEWFQQSRSSKDNQFSDWYFWRDAKADGTAPNNWLSYFGGPAWSWDSRREQYYLHQFLSSQPQLNLWNSDAKKAVFDTARFWLDKGVDGFRLDVAHAYLVDKELRDNPARQGGFTKDIPSSNPMSRQVRLYNANIPENMGLLKEIRTLMDEYQDRCALAESGGEDSEKSAAEMIGEDRLHLAYSFGLVGSKMTATQIKNVISGVEKVIGSGRFCFATSNHDFSRVVSRYTGSPKFYNAAAKLNMLMGLSLRGSYCLYQGEELGLPQADLKFEDLQDPYDKMLYPNHVGRDGCRTPFVWQKNAVNAGFSSSNAPWLPMGFSHQNYAVDVQEDDKNSVLNLYRATLNFRKNSEIFMKGDIEVLDTPENILAYLRSFEGQKILCIFNISEQENSFICGFNLRAIEPFQFGIKQNGKELEMQEFGAGYFKIL